MRCKACKIALIFKRKVEKELVCEEKRAFYNADGERKMGEHG